MRKLLFAAAAVSLLAGSAPTLAAPCKDAKGKFVKCPKAPTTISPLTTLAIRPLVSSRVL